MRVSLKTATIASLIVASQFLFSRLKAQTIPTSSQNVEATNRIGLAATSDFDSTYKLYHATKEIKENQDSADKRIEQDLNKNYTLTTYMQTLQSTPLYGWVSFSHLSNIPTTTKVPGVNFLCPTEESDFNNKFFLNFEVGKSDFASLTPASKAAYPGIIQTIVNNINNGIEMSVSGGSSLTVAPGADSTLRATDSLRNVHLARERALTIAKAINGSLSAAGISQQKIKKFLVTDVQSHGDQMLLIKKTGPEIQNQYAVIKVIGKGEKKYPYHVLVVDPVSAQSSSDLHKKWGEGYLVDCTDRETNKGMELGSQIRLVNIQNFTAAAWIDVHVGKQSHLAIAVSAPNGLADGTFTLEKTDGKLALSLDGKQIAVVNNVDGSGNSININQLPYFVISDKKGNYHLIQMNKKLSEYYPDAIMDPYRSRNDSIMASLKSLGSSTNGNIWIVNVDRYPAAKEALKTLQNLGYKGNPNLNQIQTFLNGPGGHTGQQLPAGPRRPNELNPPQQKVGEYTH